MEFPLPKLGKEPIPLKHFPTRSHALIFRACEYVPYAKIAEILETTEEKVRQAAADMGLPEYDPGDIWLKKGYITIIRQLWHLLPYTQLLQLLEKDEQTLAVILREEDFLDIKLSDKPVCEPVVWEEPTQEQKERLAQIKEAMQEVDISGKKPFCFEYQVPQIKFSGKELFQTRMIYAFSGLYQDAFEAANHYYFSKGQLAEKIVNCKYLIEKYQSK